jgi:hypothetical protein
MLKWSVADREILRQILRVFDEEVAELRTEFQLAVIQDRADDWRWEIAITGPVQPKMSEAFSWHDRKNGVEFFRAKLRRMLREGGYVSTG